MKYLPSIIAALRHLGSYSAGLVTALVLAGMNHDQAVALANALVSAGNGLAEILGAVAIVAPIVMGALAAKKATPGEQLKAVAKMPDVQTVIVSDSANGKVGAIAADPDTPKVITEKEAKAP